MAAVIFAKSESAHFLPQSIV